MTALKVPPLGESIVEATVSRWIKKEGDAVSAGDTIVELDTDKITVEVPAVRAGKLVKQAFKEGDVVHVDDVLGEVDESAAGAAAPATTAQPATSAAAPAQPTNAVPGSEATRSAPAARRAADAAGVDISAIAGTGRGGMVSKPDVLAATAALAAAPPIQPSTPATVMQPAATTAPEWNAGATSPATPPAPRAPTPGPALRQAPPSNGQRETREKLNTRRKRIADNLLQSHLATAHLTTFNEIDMSGISALRERTREKIEKQHGTKLSFMPFFVRATCIALRDYPIVNAQLDGDEIVYKNYVNMGIAVASEQGLVVPNVKDADRKGLLEISRDIGALAKKARDVKLTMDDLTGGSFTITNGGVFGSLVSTPIINYPQVAILGLHKIQERPIALDGQVVIRPMMYVALSYDHRIIDGQAAVLFLVRVKELMEDPASMLID